MPVYQVIEIEHHREFTFEWTLHVCTDPDNAAKVARDALADEPDGVVVRVWTDGVCSTMPRREWLPRG